MEQKLTLLEAVKRRKSTRSYDMNGLGTEQLSRIMEYADDIPLLFPGIKIKAELIGADDVKSIMKWRAPHYLSLYAEEGDAGLMNIGFVYEQLVLYMTMSTANAACAGENMLLAATELGLGSCYLMSPTMAFNIPEVRAAVKLPESVQPVALIVFGYTDDTAPHAERPGNPDNIIYI